MSERPSTGIAPDENRALVTFRVIEAPRERVFNAFSDPSQLAEAPPPPRTQVDLVGWRQVFETAAERDRIAKFAVQANEQNLDRLTAHVLGKV